RRPGGQRRPDPSPLPDTPAPTLGRPHVNDDEPNQDDASQDDVSQDDASQGDASQDDASQGDVNDDELIERLRGLLPPVPDHLPALGPPAFAWLLPAASRGALTFAPSETPAGVRGGGPRLLTFNGPGIGVEIEICDRDEVCDRDIVGQLAPPAGAEVILRSPH